MSVSHVCVCVCLVLDSHPLLAAFQVMLFEHIIMCRLITGNKTAAIQEANITLLSCYIDAFVYRAVTSGYGRVLFCLYSVFIIQHV